jgi:hypothetical protein
MATEIQQLRIQTELSALEAWWRQHEQQWDAAIAKKYQELKSLKDEIAASSWWFTPISKSIPRKRKLEQLEAEYNSLLTRYKAAEADYLSRRREIELRPRP